MLRGGVVDSVDREPQDGVMPPFFRAAPGAGEHCLSGAPCQGASTLPRVQLSWLRREVRVVPSSLTSQRSLTQIVIQLVTVGAEV